MFQMKKLLHKLNEHVSLEIAFRVLIFALLAIGFVAFEKFLEHGKGKLVSGKPPWAKMWYLHEGVVHYDDRLETVNPGTVVLDARNPETILIDSLPDGPLHLEFYSFESKIGTGRLMCADHGKEVCPVTVVEFGIHNELRVTGYDSERHLVYDLLFVPPKYVGRKPASLGLGKQNGEQVNYDDELL